MSNNLADCYSRRSSKNSFTRSEKALAFGVGLAVFAGLFEFAQQFLLPLVQV